MLSNEVEQGEADKASPVCSLTFAKTNGALPDCNAGHRLSNRGILALVFYPPYRCVIGRLFVMDNGIRRIPAEDDVSRTGGPQSRTEARRHNSNRFDQIRQGLQGCLHSRSRLATWLDFNHSGRYTAIEHNANTY